LSADDQIEIVQIIGKTLLLFSKHPDNPKIKFPN